MKEIFFLIKQNKQKKIKDLDGDKENRSQQNINTIQILT